MMQKFAEPFCCYVRLWSHTEGTPCTKSISKNFPTVLSLLQIHCGNPIISTYSMQAGEPRYSTRYSDWLWAGRPTSRSSSPGRVKNFLFSKSSRTVLRSTQSPIQWVPGVTSSGAKRPGCEADHSSLASAQAKKMWVYTSTIPYAFMA
jgi:hypothetical protein